MDTNEIKGKKKRITKNLIGQRFGRLRVLSFDHVDDHGNTYWKCLCECGNEKTVQYSNLVSGDTISCGCYAKERMITHGGSDSALYTTWTNIKARCFNKNARSYQWYGQRGITMCKEWADSFAEFRDWAYQSGYSPSLSKQEQTIDRIDNNGNYEPSNCRWTTWDVQCRNRRRNDLWEYNGKKQCLTDWAKEYNIPQNTLFNRIHVLDWTFDEAITMPHKKGNNKYLRSKTKGQ